MRLGLANCDGPKTCANEPWEGNLSAENLLAEASQQQDRRVQQQRRRPHGHGRSAIWSTHACPTIFS